MKVEDTLRKIHVVDGLTLCNDYGLAQMHSVDGLIEKLNARISHALAQNTCI